MTHSAYLTMKTKLYYFFIVSTLHIPTYDSQLKGWLERNYRFLDVLIGNNRSSPVASVYRKKTFTGPFAPSSYKLGLLSTLFHRVYQINST